MHFVGGGFEGLGKMGKIGGKGRYHTQLERGGGTAKVGKAS